MKAPDRQHPAHGVIIRNDEPTLVFLTINMKDRRPRLSNPEVHAALHELWSCEARAWLVGDYVLMPDHLHLFCAPGRTSPEVSIERWFRFWKSRSSQRLGWGSGAWQRDGSHHRIRSVAEYQEKWAYVRQNPVRAGLASGFEDWPYRGCVQRLEWFDRHGL